MAVSEIKPKSTETTGGSAMTSFVGLPRLIPNLMTLIALAAGLTAIQYAWDSNWERAVLAILIAAVMVTLLATNSTNMN